MRNRQDPVFDRDDVNAVLAVLMDIRRELSDIRILLSEEDGEEEEQG
jgi:hypothetical protein